MYQHKNDARLRFIGYNNIISRYREDEPRGGVGFFIKDDLTSKQRDGIEVFIPHIFESVFIKITNRANSRSHAVPDIFSRTMQYIVDTIQHENESCVFMGDMKIDSLKCGNHSKTNEYLDTVIPHGYLSVIINSTRICS